MKEIDITKIPAYQLVKKEDIEELSTTGYLLKHKKSGARVLLLVNDDNNKVFNIGFRTPPADDTGVPHIIEHTVLCGSKKYPPKDPFVELVKGSLNTFLNAMTFPDKTIFPVASCNEKDFKNLMNVYLDAVFYPNIYEKEEIFRQEGWSYELEDKDGKLALNGVVYNEMKGALSSPDSILEREIQREMFRDTCYSYESGGDPEFIPDLTYEQFLEFHRKYYHPVNSYITLYGDMDMEERLNWMDQEYLDHFEEIQIDSEIQYQKPFERIKQISKKYPLGQEEDEKEKTIYSYTVTAGNATDRMEYYAMRVLDYALISMPGAPLKKALLDAGIGKDISGGYSGGSLQNTFSVIAKEAEEGKGEEFFRIIEEVLEKTVQQGLDKDSIKAALNVIEFQYREADFGSYPKGLFYCMDSLESWLYDDNEPFMHIKAGDTFEELKKKDTHYFEELIETYFLKNTHKLLLTLEPEKGLDEKKNHRLEEKLTAYKASLSEEELDKIIRETAHLKQYQSEPSTEEELKTIPLLRLEDIDKYPQKFSIEERVSNNIKVIFSNVKSNGIAYINVAFHAEKLSQDMIPYLALLKAVLANMDTEHFTYTELNNYINMHTGGFGNDFVQYGKKDGSITKLFENDIKVFYPKMKEAFVILEEVLLHTRFSDTKRLYEIIAENKSKMRMRLISSGHLIAVTRANSYMCESGYVKDMTSGAGYYHFLDKLEKNFDEKKQEIVDTLEELVKKLFTKQNVILSFTAEEAGYECMEGYFKEFTDRLYESTEEEKPNAVVLRKLNEGLKIPSPVSYVARVGNFKKAGYEYNGAMDTLRNILDYDYLWNNVRVKGGAYGVSSNYGATTGNVMFVSYRDPNVEKTNDVFEGIPEYLRNFDADEREVLKFIIGTISGKDTPINPAAQGRRSFAAYLSDISYEDICKEREEILSLNVQKVRALAPVIEAVLAQDYICVVGNSDKIEEGKELFGEVKDLLV